MRVTWFAFPSKLDESMEHHYSIFPGIPCATKTHHEKYNPVKLDVPLAIKDFLTYFIQMYKLYMNIYIDEKFRNSFHIKLNSISIDTALFHSWHDIYRGAHKSLYTRTSSEITNPIKMYKLCSDLSWSTNSGQFKIFRAYRESTFVWPMSAVVTRATTSVKSEMTYNNEVSSSAADLENIGVMDGHVQPLQYHTAPVVINSK